MLNASLVNEISSCSIQLPDSSRAMPTARIFGTNASVESCSWVTAWNSDTAKPTTRAVRSMGAESLAPAIIICRASSVTAASVIPAYP